VTQNWKDIPKEANNKAQPFLLEDMMGTDKKIFYGMVRALLTQVNPGDKNLAVQIWEHLEQEMIPFKTCSKGFHKAKKAPLLTILRNTLQPKDGLGNLMLEMSGWLPIPFLVQFGTIPMRTKNLFSTNRRNVSLQRISLEEVGERNPCCRAHGRKNL
jgi:hypothetical protein